MDLPAETSASLNRAELVSGVQRDLIDAVADRLHAGELVQAGQILAAFMNRAAPRGRPQSEKLCWELVRWCLDRDHYADAALLLWPASMFTPKPRCTSLIWDALDGYNTVMLMGASSMSKSYAPGVYFFLDWLRDPLFTQVLVIGPTQDHLNRNLFSHLTRLHMRSSLKMPGDTGEMFIGINRRDQGGGMLGVVMPRGPRASGKLQGAKRFNRPAPHPKFGIRSRLRVVLDEFEHVPVGVFSDIDNLVSNLDDPEENANTAEGLKIVGAFNPKDITGPVAVRAEPTKGWKQLDPDDEVWTSARGWRVVRLDGEKCENVVQGRTVYPGLQTRAGLDKLALNTGGRESPGYLTFGRAIYPEVGSFSSVMSAATLHDWEADVIWAEKPTPVGGVDTALEGGANCVECLGLYGQALGFRYPAGPLHPAGREVLFKTADGRQLVRPILLIVDFKVFPKAKSVAMAAGIRTVSTEAGVTPRWLGVDRTGNGAGVHDILVETWSDEVLGVNNSWGATSQKIVLEDTKTPEDEYANLLTELYFAPRKWFEFGLIKIKPGLEHKEKLAAELTGRRYDTRGKMRVERKPDYTARQPDGASPDFADAFVVTVHRVRVNTEVPAGLLETRSVSADDSRSDEPLPCDPSNNVNNEL